MDKDERIAREGVVAAARDLDAQGLNRGTSGNVSVRFRDGLLITPSGVPTARMGPDDIVPMALDGTYPAGLKPSSEWRFHRDILAARPEVGAVVHAHPIHCTAFALCGRQIPAVHYMIAAFGGPNVRCAPYAPYGTAELSELALAALEGRNVCLLANHGMIAAGGSLEKAVWLAVELETLCWQYAVALQVGAPNVLSDHEIANTVERFRGYGLNATD
ncbi:MULTISPECIES: class II aldolase/adducin family protein [unclassified Methylobacterium]|uniref:class II aldolase/adducin family protein n=1 Tax=unclassified Methylobacterium TaxID=2615210 RepID=UPI0011C1F2D5|nr:MULTISPECIES: class II aldolase/adducin family protein [unclassified Methylobacterium]QEE40029.1 class II aldolase [Methylobacterium sp. WL1]TXN58612.1 class II aldolase [Methylobacterium sp. WL2]